MKPGDRVLFVASWSSFKAMRGTVASTSPALMVTVDGDDDKPICVSRNEVVPLDAPSEVSMTGAE